MGGLAEIKTERIKAILATLKQEQGSISLEYIREMEDEELKAELTRWGSGSRGDPETLLIVFGSGMQPAACAVPAWLPGLRNLKERYQKLTGPAHPPHRSLSLRCPSTGSRGWVQRRWPA